MEQERDIELYTKDGSSAIERSGLKYKRRVDIILRGTSTSETKPNDENTWIEVKSLKRQANFAGWNRWDMKKKGTGIHRQYYLDRVASTDNPLDGWKEEDRAADDYVWWLQDFKRKPQGETSFTSYQKSDLKTLYKKVRILPVSKSNGEAESSVGETSKKHEQPLDEVGPRLKLFNLKTWLLGEAKEALLEGVDADVIRELVTNNPEF